MLAQRVSTFIAFQRRLWQPLAACTQSYIPVRVACWKCDSVSLPGWQLEVLVPPAGVQKSNVCFTCSSLCSHELDTILSSTVPLVWAASCWISGKCRQALRVDFSLTGIDPGTPTQVDPYRSRTRVLRILSQTPYSTDDPVIPPLVVVLRNTGFGKRYYAMLWSRRK